MATAKSRAEEKRVRGGGKQRTARYSEAARFVRPLRGHLLPQEKMFVVLLHQLVVPHLHVHIFAGRPLGPMLAR